jgi:hypothetical protein
MLVRNNPDAYAAALWRSEMYDGLPISALGEPGRPVSGSADRKAIKK